jgi:hypothetical protein
LPWTYYCVKRINECVILSLLFSSPALMFCSDCSNTYLFSLSHLCLNVIQL